MTLNQDVISLILEYAYGSTNCVLEDCNLPNCHNCFPVKNCRCNHYKCIKEGVFQEYDKFLLDKIFEKID